MIVIVHRNTLQPKTVSFAAAIPRDAAPTVDGDWAVDYPESKSVAQSQNLFID
jgi:hypothetical protein